MSNISIQLSAAGPGYAVLGRPFYFNISAVMNNFVLLCGDPDEHKLFEFTTDDPDDGFNIRKPEIENDKGLPYDDKSLFHYRRKVHELYSKTRGGIYPKYDRWLEELSKIHSYATNAMRDIYEVLNRDFPGILEAFDNATEKDLHVIRLLQYRNVTGSESDTKFTILGKAHQDRSGLTWPIYETHPGLEIYSEDQYVGVEDINDDMVIFPGQAFALATGGVMAKKGKYVDAKVVGGNIPAMTHRIVSVKSPSSYVRLSIVFFSYIDPQFTAGYKK